MARATRKKKAGAKPARSARSAARTTAPDDGRRRPVQKRSLDRVDAILDATAEVLHDEGLAAFNTNRVAERAGVAVGSIYQYFPNKEALVDALAMRSLQRLDRVLEEAGFRDDVDPGEFAGKWEEILDRIIDAVADFYRNELGFRVVWLQGPSAELQDKDWEHDQVLAERLERLFAEPLGHLGPARRRTVATIVVVVAGPLFGMMVRVGPRRSKTIVEETRRLLRGYLRSHLEEGRGTLGPSPS